LQGGVRGACHPAARRGRIVGFAVLSPRSRVQVTLGSRLCWYLQRILAKNTLQRECSRSRLVPASRDGQLPAEPYSLKGSIFRLHPTSVRLAAPSRGEKTVITECSKLPAPSERARGRQRLRRGHLDAAQVRDRAALLRALPWQGLC